MGAGLGGLHEVKYKWTLDELSDAHEYLEIKREAEAHMAHQQNLAMQKGRGA